jgi:hypothetical protein
MRTPLVKRQTAPSERFLAFFPRSRAWRSRPSVSSADLISMSRCTPPWLHQTRIEALSPWQWRVQRDAVWSLCGLETYLYPHTGLFKGVAERVPFASECQARVRGSTREPLATCTVWQGERRVTCGLLLSSLPNSTIAYQRVCWGGASISIKGLQATAYSVRSCVAPAFGSA